MSNDGHVPYPPNPDDPQQPGQPGQPGDPASGWAQGGAPGTPPPPPPGAGGYGYGYPPPGGPRPYAATDAFGYGWKKFTANVGPILLVSILYVVAIFVAQVISGLISHAFDWTGSSTAMTNGQFSTGFHYGFGFGSIASSFVGALLVSVVSAVLQAAIIRGSLNITYGRELTIGGMFEGVNFAQVILTSLLVGIMTAIGVVLCILPGIVLWFLSSFAMYYVVDKDMPAVEAIKASFALVSKNAGTLLVFFLLAILAYVAGLVACCVGILVAIPVVLIAQAYTYRSLQGETVAP